MQNTAGIHVYTDCLENLLERKTQVETQVLQVHIQTIHKSQEPHMHTHNCHCVHSQQMGVESACTIAPNYSGKTFKNGLEWRGEVKWSGEAK